MKAPVLLVVDGHAYAYRAFYAIRELRSPSGAPTNAIFGFIKMFEKLKANLDPSHAVIVWDGGLAKARTELLAGYKAQRPPTPPDLEAQFPAIEAFLGASRVVSLKEEGVEADDLIGSVVSEASRLGWKSVVASSDKDFMQLVTPEVALVNPGDPELKLWGAQEVSDKTGVTPQQIVDWLSLIGDAVDNIPGVTGVGPRTATRLLSEFGSVSAIYSRIAEVGPEGLRARLMSGKAEVERNRKMIALECALPITVRLDSMKLNGIDVQVLARLYEQWGFRTLRRQLLPLDVVQAELF